VGRSTGALPRLVRTLPEHPPGDKTAVLMADLNGCAVHGRSEATLVQLICCARGQLLPSRTRRNNNPALDVAQLIEQSWRYDMHAKTIAAVVAAVSTQLISLAYPQSERPGAPPSLAQPPN
jgi:hypothetical protein